VRLEGEHRQHHEGDDDEECVDRRLVHEDHRFAGPVGTLLHRRSRTEQEVVLIEIPGRHSMAVGENGPRSARRRRPSGR
jgi:hypothetical protein